MIEEDAHLFAGLMTDDLFYSALRSDAIHLNEADLREHAERWADVITAFMSPAAALGDFNANGIFDVDDLEA